ncbi:hypothetical protein [Microcoleus vaginatus]
MYALASEGPDLPGLLDEYHPGNHKSCAIAALYLIIQAIAYSLLAI